MILEKMEYDLGGMIVRSDARSYRETLEEIISLLMVSAEFGLRKMRMIASIRGRDEIDVSIRDSFEENPILDIVDSGSVSLHLEKTGDQDICRHPDLVVTLDGEGERRYRIEARSSATCPGIVSRLAGILACVLGFPGYMSFGTRFFVFELLNNIVEHGAGGFEDGWITVVVDGCNDTLTLTVRDPFREFNPTTKREFDLAKYIESGMTRGLGLMMIHKMDHRMSYARRDCYNETVISRISPGGQGMEKEESMSTFIVGKPQKKDGGVHEVSLSGELDAKGALTLEQTVSSLMDMKAMRVVLDFSSVTFVSSAGVGMLLGLVSSMKRAGGELVFKEVSQKVRSVFSLLNLEDYFNLTDAAGRRT